jgi:hypothetical protein
VHGVHHTGRDELVDDDAAMRIERGGHVVSICRGGKMRNAHSATVPSAPTW